MKLRSLPIEGWFEDEDGRISEVLQIAEPESDTDRQLLRWAILSHGETVGDDESRRDYTFSYRLGEEIEPGLYKLEVRCLDASAREHSFEIAAGLVTTPAPTEAGDRFGFVPMWFIDESLHFKPMKNAKRDVYHGVAFGRLLFDAPDNLPQRRLFGAAV